MKSPREHLQWAVAVMSPRSTRGADRKISKACQHSLTVRIRLLDALAWSFSEGGVYGRQLNRPGLGAAWVNTRSCAESSNLRNLHKTSMSGPNANASYANMSNATKLERLVHMKLVLSQQRNVLKSSLYFWIACERTVQPGASLARLRHNAASALPARVLHIPCARRADQMVQLVP